MGLSCRFLVIFVHFQVIVCDELNIGDAIDALDNVETLTNVIVIGKPESEVKSCIAIGDLLEDDGKSAPKRLDTDWEKQTVYLPFTSTSSGSKVNLVKSTLYMF